MSENESLKKQVDELLPRLREIFQSANINFLIGSGCSTNYLPTLGTIEDDINKAIKDKNTTEQANGYKNYLTEVMLPNKTIISGDLGDKEQEYTNTFQNYQNFLTRLTQLIIDRKTTVIGKQVNIFTTNIDIFFETVLEHLELHYNDGFIGKMNPVFDLSNFKQSIIQRSHHYDNRSEIPVFNLLKIHGSVNWMFKQPKEIKNRKIYLSRDLSHLNVDTQKTDEDFIKEYKDNILVVNPEDVKFSDTVLNMYYYELLRSYSSELERENSVLFVIGFSMADQHIREITQRAAKSNPTLQIYIFCYSNGAEMRSKMESEKYPNIKIIAPEYEQEEDKFNFDLKTVSEEIFDKITSRKSQKEPVQVEIIKSIPKDKNPNLESEVDIDNINVQMPF